MSKQTHRERERAIETRFESSFLDIFDVADTCRRDASTGVAGSHCRRASIRLREYEANTKVEGRERDSNATPNTTRYVHYERPPPTGSETCQAADAVVGVGAAGETSVTLNRDRAPLLDALHSFLSPYLYCISTCYLSFYVYCWVFRFVPYSVFGSLIHDWSN